MKLEMGFGDNCVPLWIFIQTALFTAFGKSLLLCVLLAQERASLVPGWNPFQA